MKKIKAWYFSDESRKLRFGDGRDIVLGKTHEVDGEPVLCKHGLHASRKLVDALQYAPGPVVYEVELSGEIVERNDKLVATRRKYIRGGIDISDTLMAFARKQALSVAHLWDMPEVVRRYLETGDKTILAAAWAAADAAARAAAVAADNAADAAAWAAAATGAADRADRAAAWAAAATGAADRADRAAAPADIAAWAAADAAADAAMAATGAADRADRAAAPADRAAAWAAAEKMLTEMVDEAIRGKR